MSLDFQNVRRENLLVQKSKILIGGLSAALIAVVAAGGYEMVHLQRELSQETASNAQLKNQVSQAITKDKQDMATADNEIASLVNSSAETVGTLTNAITSVPTVSTGADLTASNVRVSGSGGTVYVTGLATNNGQLTVYIATVNATVFAKDGTVLGTGQEPVYSVPAGGQVGFHVRVGMINTQTPIDHATATIG